MSEKKKKSWAALDQETHAWLRAWVFENITDTYEYYDKAKAGGYARKEPCLTASYLREELEQGHVPSEHDKYTFLPKRYRNRIIQSHLVALKKAGKLDTAIGESVYGREARCYEPAGRYEGTADLRGLRGVTGSAWWIVAAASGLVLFMAWKRGIRSP